MRLFVRGWRLKNRALVGCVLSTSSLSVLLCFPNLDFVAVRASPLCKCADFPCRSRLEASRSRSYSACHSDLCFCSFAERFAFLDPLKVQGSV
jgi:hypothetical protein